MGSFKDAGRRAFVGPRTVLKTISNPEDGDFIIAPRKYSQQTADEMRELRVAFLRKGSNREDIREYEAIIERLRETAIAKAKAAGVDIEIKDVTAEAGAEDKKRLSEIFSTVEMDPAYQSKLCELALLGGIGWHNFTDEKGAPVGGGDHLDHATVSHLLEYMAPTAMEAFGIIDGFNGPLAQGSAPTSAMSPSGTSEAQSSRPENRSPTSMEVPATGSPQT